jgi:copper resistance protein B
VVFLLLSLLLVHRSFAQTTSSPPPTSNEKHPDWGPPVRDNQVLAHALFEQFEGRATSSSQMLRWDGQGWVGTDTNRLWVKSEGFSDGQQMSDGDHEALYDRPIPHMRYFDAQVGVRADLDSGPRRAWAAVGVEGLAPWFFELAPTLYIRDGGHLAGRVESSWELNITQRLVLEPQAELNFYSKDDGARKIGSGLSDLDAGVRLRYEIKRKFAPYVGFAYSGGYNGTASYERQVGERVKNRSFVFGLRTWY